MSLLDEERLTRQLVRIHGGILLRIHSPAALEPGRLDPDRVQAGAFSTTTQPTGAESQSPSGQENPGKLGQRMGPPLIELAQLTDSETSPDPILQGA